MTDKHYTSTTRVKVTIEIDGSGPYGTDWHMDDIIKQSRNETLSDLTHRLAKERIRIIGEPVVSIITFERQP